MPASYRWVITIDRITEEGEIITLMNPREGSIVGQSGPSNEDKNLKSNPQRFSVYAEGAEHGEMICYAEGMLYSTDAAKDYEEACFGPLDDYAGPALGCTAIKIDGKWMSDKF